MSSLNRVWTVLDSFRLPADSGVSGEKLAKSGRGSLRADFDVARENMKGCGVTLGARGIARGLSWHE